MLSQILKNTVYCRIIGLIFWNVLYFRLSTDIYCLLFKFILLYYFISLFNILCMSLNSEDGKKKMGEYE